jgi:hypothetical protein
MTMPDTTIALYAYGPEGNAEVTKLQAARYLATQERGGALTIYELDGEKVLERVEVYPRHKAYGDMVIGAKVNWSGIGSVGAGKARRYAEMLTLAAELIELSDLLAAEAA